jgi:hypothetical protein
MAESMTVQTLSYVADLLKFVAVPFAVMEILGPDQRKGIERAIIKRTKSTWQIALYLSVPTFVGLHIFVFFASHLVLMFFVALVLYFLFQIIAFATAKTAALVAGSFLWGGAGLLILVGALIAWLVPYPWLTALFYPVEWGLALLRSVNTFWAPLVPAFDAHGIISAYRDSVAATQAYIYGIWWGIKIFVFMYFLASDGLVFVVLFCLQITFFLFIAAMTGLFLLAPAAAFVLFSERLKRRFDATDKGVLPLGALVIWAAGETLNMSVSTYKYFWTAG